MKRLKNYLLLGDHMVWKNKFIISFITLVLSICVFSGMLILQPFKNKSIALIVFVICIFLFFFATYFSTIYYRRWRGYYSIDNKFFINIEHEKELFDKAINNLKMLNYCIMKETDSYYLYEIYKQKEKTTYYFLIYKDGNNHKDKSYSKLMKALDNNLKNCGLKLSTKSGHLVVIEKLSQLDKTKLYSESKKMTMDLVLFDYDHKCAYVESSSLLNAVEQRREIKKVLKDIIIF